MGDRDPTPVAASRTGRKRSATNEAEYVTEELGRSTMARVSFDDFQTRVAASETGSNNSSATNEHDSPATQDDYFSAPGTDDGFNDDIVSQGSISSRRAVDLHIQIPPAQLHSHMAFTALQYLPMPVLVLSSAKTVVLANEAMGHLLGITLDLPPPDNVDLPMDHLQRVVSREASSSTDVLYGVTPGDLGLDILQNGAPMFVSWDSFLNSVLDDASHAQSSTTQLNTYREKRGDVDNTPTGRGTHHRRSTSEATPPIAVSGVRTEVHDAVVQVVFSTRRDPRTGLPLPVSVNTADDEHIHSEMIISIWATEDEQYFTLTFTAAAAAPAGTSGSGGTPSEPTKTTSRTVSRAATSYSNSVHSGSGVDSGPSSNSSSRNTGVHRHHHARSKPTSVYASPLSMEFPPRGPPTQSAPHAPSLFAKTNRLKQALLNSMSMPAYAMWKDETFGIPNKAAIRLILPNAEDGEFDAQEQAKEFLLRFVLYKEDFSETIPLENYPIMRVMKTRAGFQGYRVGMYSAKDGSRMLYDTSGETLLDDKGDFVGGEYHSDLLFLYGCTYAIG